MAVTVEGGEGRLIASLPGTVFEGTIDETPGTEGTRLTFKTGRDDTLVFTFPNETNEPDFGSGTPPPTCSEWVTEKGLQNPVEDNATVSVVLLPGASWSGMVMGDVLLGRMKINPETKKNEFWWVLRYDLGECTGNPNEGCNLSDYVMVSYDGQGWTITGELAWVHDNFERPDGANCTMPFLFRVERAP